MKEILLIEDDPILARGVQVALELEGFSTLIAPHFMRARELLTTKSPNLILLDLNLPDGSGFEFLQNSKISILVIILTAQAEEESVVRGLELGAQDYVRKPFGNRELVARIKSVLKGFESKETPVSFASLTLNIEKRTASASNRVLDLSRREFDILQILVSHAENIVTREFIINQINQAEEIFDRTVDSHVSHLRTHLRKANVTDFKISSVYGVGYRLEKTQENSDREV